MEIEVKEEGNLVIAKLYQFSNLYKLLKPHHILYFTYFLM